ncbi:MAG: antibiotic biosynthesis monooxygenase [Candidatus Saccharimonas sp.]|nr:antibiotic biosynthesis monooxygenase [Planctomycetaceae bacterium]
MNSTTTNTESAITVSQDPGVVTVIERFDMPENLQGKAVELAESHIARAWRNEPSFVGAALLRCHNRGGVSCYSQWKRPSDGSPITPDAPTAAQTLAVALEMFRTTTYRRMDSRTYTLDFSKSVDGVALPSLVSLAKTPGAHFGVFSVTRETQNHLLELARAYGPTSLVTPGLVSINFHRSLDGKRVINLGLWSDFDHWEDLNKLSDFKGDAMYWEHAVDDWQPDLFKVVAVESVN